MVPRILIALTRDFPGIARLPCILKRHVVSVSVISPPKFQLQHTRFAAARHTCSDDPATAVEELRCHLERESYDMVMPADDSLLEALARRSSEAWVRAILPIDADRIASAILYSKAAFMKVVEHSEIPMPATHVCNTRAEAESAARELGFPLIFKEEIGHSGAGVRKILDAGALETQLAAHDFSRPILLQAEIKGSIATADVLFDRGKLRAWVCSYALRTRGGPYGSSSVREFVNIPQAEPIIEKVGRATGYHGLAGLDFIHEQPSGRMILLEMNSRPTPGHAIARAAGVDFGRELSAMLRGEAPRKIAAACNGPVRVPMFPEDFERSITEKEVAGLLKWMLPPYWRYMPLSDPRLMLHHAGDAWTRFSEWVMRSGKRESK